MNRVRHIDFAIVAALLAAGSGMAAEVDWPRPTAQALRATGGVRLDGKLDDAAWATTIPGSA
jgi:hypothetical protein